jgi:hypothetical protein
VPDFGGATTFESESDLGGDEEQQLEEEEDIATIFEHTEPKEWKRIGGRSVAKEIDLVPFTGENEHFAPNVNDTEFKSFLDQNGDI